MCASGQYQHAPQQMSCHKCSTKKLPYTEGDTELHKWWTRNEAGATKCYPVPFNCVPEAWGSWGSCSKSCNGGRRTRTRGILHPSWAGGTSCSNFEEEEPCNDHCCPIDCIPADWSLHLWGSCTKSCGGGSRSRSRPISAQHQCGGKPCTRLEDDEVCNQRRCPVDCEMHLWSSWATCSEGCGTGTQTRVRAVKQEPLFGGKKCPHASEQQLCNRQCCKGFFHSGADGFSCTACTAGHFAAGEGVSACDQCPEGKYQTFTGHHECSECPKGTFQPKRAMTSLEIDCQHCGPGKYQDGVAKSHCENCAAGRANAELKRTDATDCRACNAGQYADQVGTVACKDCDVGTFSSNTAATSCTDCAAGRHNPYMSRSSERYCYICPCGKWSSSGSNVCIDCAPGKFRASAGGSSSSSCDLAAAGFEPSRLWASTTNDKCGQSACPVGKYQDEVGGARCKECPAGTHNPTVRATSLDACATCPKGTWSSSGKSSCTDCTAGRHSPMPGAGAVTLCKACRPGSYAPTAASFACTHCEPGRWQNAGGSTACQLCQAGKFSTATGAPSDTTCKRCDVGFFQPMPGLTECIACGIGKFADAEGLTSCASCPKGTANGGTASASASACITCGAGHYADERASSTCKQCAIGRAVPATGSTDAVACRHCSAGQYADAKGSGTCKKCEKGKHGQNTIGASSEFVHCLRCPAGKFQQADGMTKCLKCVSGKYTAFHHDKVACHACAVVDSVRRYDTRGLAGQMQCWPVPVSCKVGAWGTFNTCTKSCGTGQRTRMRQPLRQPASGTCGLADQSKCNAAWGGGKICTEIGLSNTQSCNTHPCPVDCTVSAWSHWEPCTKRCGVGESQRVRVVERPASLGGKACPALRQQEVCNAHSCALSALPSQCHSTHVRCYIDEIKRPTSTFLMGRPECARRAIDENNMCWNNNNCKTDYATPGWCHEADTAGEVEFLKRHPPHTTTALVVHQDRSHNTGQFHCERVRRPSLMSVNKGAPAEQLAVCHGDCDHDGHCQNGFVCHHQTTSGPVPGCEGSPVMGMDYCVYTNSYRGMLVNAHEDLSQKCRCVCNQHVCCSHVNKLVSGGVGVVGGRYEVDSMQECCDLCSNHPQCNAWEYSSESTCTLKRTIGATTFVDNPATASLTTWAGAKAGASCS